MVTGVKVLFTYATLLDVAVWQLLPVYPAGQVHDPLLHEPPFWHTTLLHEDFLHDV
jgi:hypothetical protein